LKKIVLKLHFAAYTISGNCIAFNAHLPDLRGKLITGLPAKKIIGKKQEEGFKQHLKFAGGTGIFQINTQYRELDFTITVYWKSGMSFLLTGGRNIFYEALYMADGRRCLPDF
jgi:hypothetical protein